MKKGGKVSSKNCLTVIDLFGNDTKTKLDEENRLLSSIFVHVRLMSWKHLQSLFQIHIINYLTSFVLFSVTQETSKCPLDESVLCLPPYSFF